jgi:hypothetical protein
MQSDALRENTVKTHVSNVTLRIHCELLHTASVPRRDKSFTDRLSLNVCGACLVVQGKRQMRKSIM